MFAAASQPNRRPFARFLLALLVLLDPTPPMPTARRALSSSDRRLIAPSTSFAPTRGSRRALSGKRARARASVAKRDG